MQIFKVKKIFVMLFNYFYVYMCAFDSYIKLKMYSSMLSITDVSAYKFPFKQRKRFPPTIG